MHRRCCLQAASSVLCTTNCKHSLVLLKLDEIIARNMLSWLKLLIKLLLLHLFGCLCYCINDARSHKHQIQCWSCVQSLIRIPYFQSVHLRTNARDEIIKVLAFRFSKCTYVFIVPFVIMVIKGKKHAIIQFQPVQVWNEENGFECREKFRDWLWSHLLANSPILLNLHERRHLLAEADEAWPTHDFLSVSWMRDASTYAEEILSATVLCMSLCKYPREFIISSCSVNVVFWKTNSLIAFYAEFFVLIPGCRVFALHLMLIFEVWDESIGLVKNSDFPCGW